MMLKSIVQRGSRVVAVFVLAAVASGAAEGVVAPNQRRSEQLFQFHADEFDKKPAAGCSLLATS